MGVFRVSRAFVNDDTVSQASETVLPDRPVSPHPNLVTGTGLKALEHELQLAKDALALAAKAEDAQERKRLLAAPARDIRYFSDRLLNAKLVTPEAASKAVGFGNKVSLRYDDGRKVTYRIVGEDEADPAKGLISYVSPVARNLIGKTVGDEITVGGHGIEILEIA
jgi:transcription elongation GreA/GreB family factor